MKNIRISNILKSKTSLGSVVVKGWLRTKRDSKGFSFLELNDGSCLKNLQVVVDESIGSYGDVLKFTTGSSLMVKGNMVESPGSGQNWEIKAEDIQLIGYSSESFPLQKKRHSDEYLRTIAHLRPRTNKYGALFRLRSDLSWAIQNFFRSRDFKQIHTPVLTGLDCEGAGELFKATSLDLDKAEKVNGKIDYSKDFFGKESNLTVSGQLSLEMFALSLGNVYTFGPAFRAENSNTSRHVAEFWMLEPEMSFCDLDGNMELAETLIKYLVNFIRENSGEDLDIFTKYVDKSLNSTLDNVESSSFEKISYSEALDILNSSKKKFEYEPVFGSDLQSEHERFLTEKHFKKPVFVYDYPKNIKPFYMRVNDDNKTVAAVDLLLPRIGEIIGGSQREERLDILESRMDELNMSKENYWWYLDSRKYGSVPHSGFGMGFERLLMFITGVINIRDVIPFPRTPKHLEF